MAERIPLARLGLPAEHPAGAHDGNFPGRVAAWRDAFAGRGGTDHALHLDDAAEFAAALFGAWQAGKTVWLPGDRLPATLARLHGHVSSRAGDFPDGWRAGAAPGETGTLAELDPRRCRLVLFTSGSTGEPAAIEKRLDQLDAEVAALETAFGNALAGATVQGTVSQQHIYGLLFRVLWPLSARRHFGTARLVYNEDLLALADEATVLVASPAHLKRLSDTPDWSGLARNLRAVFSSGGPLPADAAHDVLRLWGRAAIEVLGSTETGGIAWRQSGLGAQAWCPLPGVAWRLADGRLEVRSPHLADAAWWRTADRAAPAPDGFTLLGRADRIVKIEERRVSLTAIEQRLLACDLLDDARVLALPGHRTLLAVAAVPGAAGRAVLEAEGRPGLAARLRTALEAGVDSVALPRRWRFVEALPVDAQGKASERLLRALFQPGRPEPVWEQREATRARLSLTADAGLAPFDGHFPQAAILPGVALVDWAVAWGREAFGLHGSLHRMEVLKFQHLVRPGTALALELDWRPDEACLGFRFRSGQGVHASGRLRFDPQAPA